nr:MAG TPA: hypothetical protein [Caudoviricetes sp.]
MELSKIQKHSPRYFCLFLKSLFLWSQTYCRCGFQPKYR